MKHYVLIPLEPWGHLRPETTLSLRLVQLHQDLLVTLFQPAGSIEKTASLISSFGLSSAQSERLRIVPYAPLKPPPANPFNTETDDGATWQLAVWVAGNVMPPLKKYLNGEKVCRPSESLPHEVKPDVFIVDRMLALLPELQSEGIHVEKYVSMAPQITSHSESVYKTVESPFGTVLDRYIELVDGGMSEGEAFEKTVGTNDELLDQSSGLGPMFVREMDPNSTSQLHTAMRSWHRLRRGPFGDELIVFWPSCFFPPRTGLGIITVGPQVVSATKAKGDEDVIRFLDQQKPKSLVFISFGSYSWIPDLAQTKVVIDTLDKLGLGVLVVNSLNPKFTKPRTDLIEYFADRVKTMDGRAMLVDWAPQMDVLQHQAVAFMISHAGAGSAQECMLAAQPMVAWPGGWDQPHAASELVRLGIARELIQVRTGHNVGRKTASGVLVKGTQQALEEEIDEVFSFMIGQGGVEMRKRCEEVRKMVREDMEKGKSYQNMLSLGNM